MYQMHDLYCSPTLVGTFFTVKEMKEAARKYDEKNGGDWYPLFKRYDKVRDEWIPKDYKFK